MYYFLQTLHVPPSLAQCLQYLQFLQALQFAPPEQVAFVSVNETRTKARIKAEIVKSVRVSKVFFI
jgi:hypothetical protein